MAEAIPSAYPLDFLQGILDCTQNGVMAYQSVRNEQGEVIDFQLVALNKSAEQDIGFSADQLVGRTLRQLFAHAPNPIILTRYKQVVESGQASRFEASQLMPGQQQPVWLDISAVKLNDGLVMSYNDITHRKLAAQQFQRQADLYNLALNHTTSGIMVLKAIRDGEGQVVDLQVTLLNTACSEFLGLSHTAITGRFLTSVYADTPARILIQPLMDVARTGHPLEQEEFSLESGRWLTVSASCYSHDGLIFSCSDVSQLKQSALENQQMTGQLKGVLDASMTGIVLLEAVRDQSKAIIDFRIKASNPTLVHMTGLTDETITDCLISKWADQVRKYGFFETYKRVVETGQSERMDVEIPHSNTQSEWFDVLVCRQNDGVVANFVNVTPIRQYQQELEYRNQELRQSNENLQQFAYVASHDLQEPLRKIMAFGDILHAQHQSTFPKESSDLLRRIQLAAGRMSNLIQDLLAYSRISTHRDSFRRLSITAVLEEARMDLEMTIQEKAAQIILGPLPEVLGDRTQLRQLFQNLLSNALKFHLPEQSPIVTIEAQRVNGTEIPGVLPADKNRPFWEISVADNGIGFDEKYLDRIFQVFQRLHGKSSYAGTGIGLAICKKIVDNHKGYLSASSHPGLGATFQVYLPFVQ